MNEQMGILLIINQYIYFAEVFTVLHAKYSRVC